uniref:BED-type domain-containing protein n=1 Tax=Chenopodium quinoa TaxID=63459 RepID=A0A803MWX8_CHEQI
MDHIIYDEPVHSPDEIEYVCTIEEEATVHRTEKEANVPISPVVPVESTHVDAHTMQPVFAALDKERSLVWLEFLTLDKAESSDGKQRSICKHCQKSSFISDPRYGTQNMLIHLRKCSAYERHMKNQGVNKGKVIFSQTVYRDLVAKAIIKHGYAFSWVEHDGNREVHAYLNDEVKFISRNTAKADCLRMHKTLKTRLKETLCKVSSRISLTCDMWTSCQTEGYLCLTAHYVDDNWKLISTVLNFGHIDSPHTGKTMYTAVLSMLQDWELERDDNVILRAMAIEMKSKFDKYWFNSEEDNYSMLFAFAVILDPRCKLSVLKFCYENLFGELEATLRVSELQFKLAKFYKLYTQNGMSTTVNINTDVGNAASSNTSTSTSSRNRKRKFNYFAVIVLLFLPVF